MPTLLEITFDRALRFELIPGSLMAIIFGLLFLKARRRAEGTPPGSKWWTLCIVLLPGALAGLMLIVLALGHLAGV